MKRVEQWPMAAILRTPRKWQDSFSEEPLREWVGLQHINEPHYTSGFHDATSLSLYGSYSISWIFKQIIILNSHGCKSSVFHRYLFKNMPPLPRSCIPSPSTPFPFPRECPFTSAYIYICRELPNLLRGMSPRPLKVSQMCVNPSH